MDSSGRREDGVRETRPVSLIGRRSCHRDLRIAVVPRLSLDESSRVSMILVPRSSNVVGINSPFA